MWEHIYRLHGHHLESSIEQLQVSRLCSRITTYIDQALRACIKNDIYYIGVHSCTWRIRHNDIWLSMLFDEVISENVFHISRKERSVLNFVDLAVYLCVFDGLLDILYANDTLCLTCDEVRYRARTRVKIIKQRLSCGGFFIIKWHETELAYHFI